MQMRPTINEFKCQDTENFTKSGKSRISLNKISWKKSCLIAEPKGSVVNRTDILDNKKIFHYVPH